MDAITPISPYEYIGNSLGKINQNFLNLQKLPVTLSAKYIQIDNFITSLRSQIVTNNVLVSGAASVAQTFRAEGDVVLGSNSSRQGENVIIYSSPIYLPHAIEAGKALIFGSNVLNGDTTNPSNFTGNNTRVTNLYRTNVVANRPDTLQTDGDFRVLNNFTAGGSLWLSGDAWIGDSNTDNINIKSGNIYLDNYISSNQAITFGVSNAPKLYRVSNNTLEIAGSLEITTNLTVDGNAIISGNTTLGSDNTDIVTVNGITAGEDNTVVVLDSSNRLKTDEIDARVWGTSLVDGTGTSNKLAKWSDSNTITDSSITDNGSTVSIANLVTTGHINVQNDVTAGTATLGSTFNTYGVNATIPGYIEIAVNGVSPSSYVYVTRRNASGTLGELGAICRTNIICLSALSNATTLAADSSTVTWFVVN